MTARERAQRLVERWRLLGAEDRAMTIIEDGSTLTELLDALAAALDRESSAAASMRSAAAEVIEERIDHHEMCGLEADAMGVTASTSYHRQVRKDYEGVLSRVLSLSAGVV